MARAESIQTVEKNTAVTRAKALMWFIDRKLVNLDEKSHLVEFQDNLRSIPFLPILPKPDHFPIIWKGKNFTNRKGRFFHSLYFELHGNSVTGHPCWPLSDEFPRKLFQSYMLFKLMNISKNQEASLFAQTF